MPVYFANSGHLDLKTLEILGVSVKETENPIGYFGTGMKYAVAILLRTGHKIRLKTGGKIYYFSIGEDEVRGTSIERVFLNEKPLPFTLSLGQDWEVWQAYRELYSNALDEDFHYIGTEPPLNPDTCFEVSGGIIEKVHAKRGEIFLQSGPLLANDSVEIHEGSSNYIYYRGVRAGTLPAPANYTYNILSEEKLTEDRTLKNVFSYEYEIGRFYTTTATEEMLRRIIPDKACWETAELSAPTHQKPTPSFMKVMRENRDNQYVNSGFRRIYDKFKGEDETDFTLVTLSEAESKMLTSALELIRHLGTTVRGDEFEIVESLGPNVWGLFQAKTNRIYIAHEVFLWGTETVAATIYEEILHRDKQFIDCSRNMQNFLLQRLMATVRNANYDK